MVGFGHHFAKRLRVSHVETVSIRDSNSGSRIPGFGYQDSQSLNRCGNLLWHTLSLEERIESIINCRSICFSFAD